MPKNKVSDPITDQEMAFARLILSGAMTDRHAAEAVGLNPDSAAYTKSKPRVRAYMLEHRAAVQQQLAQQEADGLHRLNLDREQVLTRLWEFANLSPEMTRGSITGQVKAISMIIAMQNFIPDRLGASWRRNLPLRTSTVETPQQTLSFRLPRCAVGAKPRDLLLYLTRNQPLTLQMPLRTLAPAGPPSPTALPPRKPPNLLSPCSPLLDLGVAFL